jgi:ferredoxin, 2Fe-2S
MKVKFVPQNVECEVKPGQSILHVAQDNNIHIKSVCRGVPSCAECRVKVTAGEHNVIQPSKTELGLIGTAWFIDGRRLSCQLRCFGDITVDLTEQVDRKDAPGKKPKGRYNKDELQESRAIMGNLIMGDKELEELKEDAEVVASAADPVMALGPDGVPTADEDEVELAEGGIDLDHDDDDDEEAVEGLSGSGPLRSG